LLLQAPVMMFAVVTTYQPDEGFLEGVLRCGPKRIVLAKSKVRRHAKDIQKVLHLGVTKSG
jgi:hypothetical protein